MSQLTWLPPLNSHKNFHVRVHAVQGDRLLFNPGSPTTLPGSLSVRLHVDVLFHDRDTLPRKILRGLSTIEDFETFQSLPSTLLAKRTCNDLLNNAYVSLQLPFQLDGSNYCETRLFPEKQESCATFRTKGVLAKQLSRFLEHLLTDPLNEGFQKVHADLFIEKWILMPSVELEAYIALYEEQDKKAYEKAISRPRTERELKEAALWYETYRKARKLRTDGELSEDFGRAIFERIKQESNSLGDVLSNFIPSLLLLLREKEKQG